MTMNEHPFTDPITNRECVLVIPLDGRVFPRPGEPKTGIRHPGCDVLADLCAAYDAFWCPACRWNGRVSGAWAIDMIEAAKKGKPVTEIWVTMLSCSECVRSHDEDGYSGGCDCWCHDGDMDLDDDEY